MNHDPQLDVAIWCNGQLRQTRTDRMPMLLGDPTDAVRISVELHETDRLPGTTPLVRIQNLGASCNLLWHRRHLELGEEAIVGLPLHIVHDDQHYEIRQHDQLTRLNRPFHTIESPRNSAGIGLIPIERLGVAPSAETLSKWFAALEQLQHNSAGTSDFFHEAAVAATNPGGMTAGFVLLRTDDEDWTVVGSHVPDPTLGISYCYDVLARVVADGRTHYHDASEDAENLPAGADSVVASPIFDDENHLLGVVYGYRSMRSSNQRRGIRALEAVWIQLLAGSVSAALSRMQSEARAARKVVLLEQVFSPKVIREITENPDALNGQERETTILFADLRDSSQISETLSAQENYAFLNELLEALSVQVRAHDGVIIDYYGDGMAAMWNAPSDQPDHALLACQAAFRMQHAVAELSARWEVRLGQPVRLGIGINTGTARVGNAGSQTRIKYGPRGTSVIVASRLESATKHLGSTILMTKATAECVRETAQLRRVCRARLAGIRQPVDVYELCALDSSQLSSDLLERIGQYQMALNLFEHGDLNQAEEVLLEYTQSTAGQQFPADFMLDVIRSSRLHPERQQGPTGVVDLE